MAKKKTWLAVVGVALAALFTVGIMAAAFPQKKECVHVWDDGKVAVAETCAADGINVFSCEKCSEMKFVKIAATGDHSFGDWTVGVAATCTTDGSLIRTCVVCEKTETEVVSCSGHMEVEDQAVAPTCLSGLTAGVHCSTCNEVLVAQETVEPIVAHLDEANDGTCDVCKGTIFDRVSYEEVKAGDSLVGWYCLPKFSASPPPGHFNIVFSADVDSACCDPSSIDLDWPSFWEGSSSWEAACRFEYIDLPGILEMVNFNSAQCPFFITDEGYIYFAESFVLNLSVTSDNYTTIEAYDFTFTNLTVKSISFQGTDLTIHRNFEKVVFNK